MNYLIFIVVIYDNLTRFNPMIEMIWISLKNIFFKRKFAVEQKKI